MRDITRELFALLQSDNFQPVEFLDITLVGQDPSYALHLTNAGQQVTFTPSDSTSPHTYTPLPMSRSDLQESVASGPDETPDVTITITNVNRQMALMVNGALTELAQATLWMTDRRLLSTLATRPRNAVRLTTGEIHGLQLGDQTLTFRIVNVIGQKQRVTVPLRIWQADCNYAFGSTACGFDRNGNDASGFPVKLPTTVQAGSTASFIVVPSAVLTAVGSPTDPSLFFAKSDIKVTGGVAGLQAQGVQRVQVVGGQVRFYLRNTFLTAPAVGDPIVIRRWCQKTLAECNRYQGNVFQFGGFPQVPPVLFKPTIVDAPGLLI